MFYQVDSYSDMRQVVLYASELLEDEAAAWS